MSTMYSLLNCIAVISKTPHDRYSKLVGDEKSAGSSDLDMVDMVRSMGEYTDDEQRNLSISVICVVTHLALEVKNEEVCPSQAFFSC